MDIIHDTARPSVPAMTITPAWRKSSRSGSNPYGNCVEVAHLPRPIPGGNGCHCCGGSRTMGSQPCPVCSGTGQCGCH